MTTLFSDCAGACDGTCDKVIGCDRCRAGKKMPNCALGKMTTENVLSRECLRYYRLIKSHV